MNKLIIICISRQSPKTAIKEMESFNIKMKDLWKQKQLEKSRWPG